MAPKTIIRAPEHNIPEEQQQDFIPRSESMLPYKKELTKKQVKARNKSKMAKQSRKRNRK